MSKRALLLAFLLAAVWGLARDKQQTWLQITSPHFTIVCNGNEKQARRIADQFERMRLVFHTVFPDMQIDPSAPIVVIAVKDSKTFRALEPAVYLKKGQLELAGLFLRAADKNYVLLRMGAGGEHPYASVYHEYTHLLLSKAEWIPLWLNEGMAEFYQNTDISEKDTVLGQASADNILWLRQNRLLPLATLFAVDHNSPYYHEEHKGSVFYAESWALTHYLEVQDAKNHTNKIRDYVVLVGNQVDAVTAATRVFGDLKHLQSTLEGYIASSSFSAFRLTKTLSVDDASFKMELLTPLQAEAVRANFLAYNDREADARVLLNQVLQQDPANTLAYETMGYLEFHHGHLQEAQHWYEQAVKLDSQSYLANYYFAAMTLNRGQSGPEIDAQIEASLQKAIKLNPSFAPAYDQLAIFYGMRHKNLAQAHMLTLQAVQLDPGNVHYRINAANVLMLMQRDADATAVLRIALKLAKTPGDTMEVQNALQAVQQSQSAMEYQQEEARRLQQTTPPSKQPRVERVQPAAQQTEAPLTGPHRTITGTVKNVRCSIPAILDFDVDAGGKTIALHAANFYKIQFSALNFTPTSELHPCSQLAGMHAKVEYIESVATRTNGPVAIELFK